MINKRSITFLFAPEVSESKNGWLAADTRQATVVIQPYTGMSAGDRLDLYWTGDKSGEYHDYVPITQAAIDRIFDFYIPASEISPNTLVTVKYAVTSTTGEKEYSQELILQVGEPGLLPAPGIDGIIGTTLYPVDIMEGANVRIAATAGLQSGDVVTLYWTGPHAAGSTVLRHIVTSAEAGNDLSFTIPANVALADRGKNITLYYEAQRGGVTLTSAVSKFIVSSVQGGKTLRVTGPRGALGAWRFYDSRGRRLVALSADTLKPLKATWQYAGETEIITDSYFYDTRPWKRLHIRTAEDSIALNPTNICDTSKAFAAIRNTGDVVAWGEPDRGGKIPATEQAITDIVGLFGTSRAFAATRKNGGIIGWGNDENGGHIPLDIGKLRDVEHIIGYGARSKWSIGNAFVALRKNGAIAAWGDMSSGGQLPDSVSTLTDITDVAASSGAFIARRRNGQVSVWGDERSGGILPEKYPQEQDIKSIFGGINILAKINTAGMMQCWGEQFSATAQGITWLCSNSAALIAYSNSERQLLGWGRDDFGALIPDNIAVLDDIVAVSSIRNGFVALRENGSVVAWGGSKTTNIPDEVLRHKDIVAIVTLANLSEMAVALRTNGTVIAWGEYNSTWNDIKDIKDVRAIYSNGYALVMLTGDGQVVTWGYSDSYNYGGDSSAVTSKLQGRVTYEVQIPST